MANAGFLSGSDNQKYFENLEKYVNLPPEEQQKVASSGNMVPNQKGVMVGTGISDFLEQGMQNDRYYVDLFSGRTGGAPPIPTPTPAPTYPAYTPSSSYSEDDWNRWNQAIISAQNVLGTSTGPTTGTSSGSSVSSAPSIVPPQNMSNYTGFVGNTPYVGGTVQTAGGGFTPDGSYSAGYHGGGGGGWYEDKGPWGTGPNNGPIVNGTMQTGGGGFTPDGSYSAGYHGSGEHPEITGESTPGQYKSGSFGSVVKPDLSNGGKVGDFLRYIGSMGYDVSKVDKQAVERQYYQSGGNFDGVAFLRTLPQANQNKTDLLSQIAGNSMMPTASMYNLLGGQGFSKLFENTLTPQAQTPAPAPVLSEVTPRIGGIPQAEQTPEEIASPFYGQLLSSSGVGGVPTAFDDELRKKKEVTKYKE